MSLMEIAQDIYDYAKRAYNEGGWDVIVECWTVPMIAERLEDWNISTRDDAFEAFEDLASIWADRQADAINSAF